LGRGQHLLAVHNLAVLGEQVLFEGVLEGGLLLSSLLLLLDGLLASPLGLGSKATLGDGGGVSFGEAGMGVDSGHGLLVLEVVGSVHLGGVGLLVDYSALNGVGHEDTTNIRVGEDGTGEEVSVLDSGGLVSGSEDGVQLLEGSLSPDDESANMTSRGKVEEVQLVDVGNTDTGQISESTVDFEVLGSNNNEGTSLNLLGSVPQASLASVSLDILATLNIRIGMELLQESQGVLGLVEGLENVGGHNQGNLRDVGDLVSAGHHEGGDGSGGNSGGNGIPPLVDVHLAVPSSPGTGGGEHTSSTAHVSEGSLACTVCTSTRDTWNTCHGSTSTPGLG